LGFGEGGVRVMILDLDTPDKIAIFCGYILSWSLMKVCTHVDSGQPINKLVILMETSVLKIVLSVLVYVSFEGSLSSFIRQLRRHKKMIIYFMIPAILYLIIDALALVILQAIDPRTFTVLSSMKTVLMGIVWSRYFNKRLMMIQWAGLLLVTAGCTVDNASYLFSGAETEETEKSGDSEIEAASPAITKTTARCLVMVEVLLVVLAAVYFERLVKDNKKISLNIQNVYMYGISLSLGLIYHFFLQQESKDDTLFDADVWMLHKDWNQAMIVILSAVGGCLTGAMMKRLDSVRKTIAMALQLIVDGILGVVVLGVPVRVLTIISSGFVAGGVFLYSQGMKPGERVKVEKYDNDDPTKSRNKKLSHKV